MMTDGKNLYLPWSEKREEIKDDLGPDEDQAQEEGEKLRGQAWDRTEDQIFIFIMTIALM
jgi:hypothetical protein